MHSRQAGAIIAVIFAVGTVAACGGGDAADQDTTVQFMEGVENAAQANPEVRELSNSNALATLYRVHDRTINRATLATERAADPTVRQFAQQMLDARANLMLDVTSAAQRLGVDFTTPLDTIPTNTVTSANAEEHTQAMEQLSGVTGAPFDTAWVRVERGVAQQSAAQLADFNDPTMDSTVSRLVGESRTLLQQETARLAQLLGGA